MHLPTAVKNQQSSDIRLTDKLLRRIKAVLDEPAGAVANATRLAPYALRLPCAEQVGAWDSSVSVPQAAGRSTRAAVPARSHSGHLRKG